MADPLSFIASLIAVGTLAVQVSTLVKHALNHSDEVLALEDELEDLKALAKQLETLCREQWPTEHQGSIDEAERILENGVQKRLQTLQSLLIKHFRKSKLRPSTVNWVLMRRKINAERTGLHISKERLLNIFHLINTSSIRRLSFQPAQLSIDLKHISNSQDRNLEDIMAHLSRGSLPPDNMNDIQVVLQMVQNIQIGVQEITQKLGHDSKNDPQTLLGLGSGDDKPQPSTRSPHDQQSPFGQDQGIYPVVNCLLEGHESKCATWCACACHSSSRYLSLPTNLERLTGQLLVGFSVHSWLRPRCNLQICKRSCVTMIRLRYRFPAWSLLRSSISLLAQPADVGITLRFPQVRPCNADVFEMVAHGRLEALRGAFSRKEASIYDVEDTGGHTLLHRALITRNADTIDFLLKQGADILAVNQKKNSAADIFWRNVLSNGLSEAAYGRLVGHFTDTTFIEEGAFTIIHKIIFRRSQASLDQMLTDMPQLINQQDAYGLSPLHWAAARGDAQYVEILLRHNANVHIVERGGSTPLIWGIDSANPEVTKLLLDAGADPDHASNIWLDRAIHIACHAERFHCQIPVLLSGGADASASSRLRDSPLEFAASRDFAVTIEALFEATHPAKHTRAVVAAVKNNALKSLQKLLELRANCLGVDAEGKTVLHHAAIHGLDPAMRLLGFYKRNLPAQTKDHSGRYPTSYAAERSDNHLSRSAIKSLFDTEKEELVDVELQQEGALGQGEEEDTWTRGDNLEEFEDALQEIPA